MSDSPPNADSFMGEKLSRLSLKLKEITTQCEDLQEHLNESEKDIIRLNEELVNVKQLNTQGQLDELRGYIEALEANDEEPLLVFRQNVAKAIEEIQDTFRNNDIILTQDDVVKDTLYRG